MKMYWFRRQKPTVALIAVLGGVSTAVQFARAQPWAAGAPVPPYAGVDWWWQAVAGSADGSRLVAAATADYSFYFDIPFGPIFVSTNAGATWTPTSCPGDIWQAVGSSADGTKLVAVATGGLYGNSGLIYSSTNAGATWTSWPPPTSPTNKSSVAVSPDGTHWLQPPLGNNWSSVAVSADGTTFIVASYFDDGGDGLIYVSTNSGASWAPSGARPNYWTSIACSADGTKWVAVTGAHDQGTNGLTLGSVYSSPDSGATWVRADTAPGNNWSSVASSADGTRWVAAAGPYSGGTLQVSGGVYISADSGATWTQANLPNNNKYWFPVVCSADGSIVIAGGSQLYVSGDSGKTWAAGPSGSWTAIITSADGYRSVAAGWYGPVFTLPYLGPWKAADAPPSDWLSLAGSSDGSKFVVASYGGFIYSSTNSGVNWRSNAAPGNPWTCVASSAKGTRLVAATSSEPSGSYGYGQVYSSGDAGATWKLASAPGSTWSSLASSADGTRIVAAASANTTGNPGSGRVYVSGDGGATWTLAAVPNNAWASVVSSADGTRLVAASSYIGSGSLRDGAMYASTNSGTTWTQIAWLDNWSSVASAAHGLNLVAATSSSSLPGFGLIYTSADGGASWVPTSAPTNNWSSVASSADGTKLVAATTDGSVYLSMDSGATWTVSDTPAGYWHVVASSADGANIVAAGNDSIIFLQIPPPAPPLPHPRLSIGLAGTGLLLEWLVPSTGFVLQQSSDPPRAGWLAVTNQPALNFSNLNNQVTLSLPAHNTFYRLKQEEQ
jgi:photosystem II stability/assembly factor-like uncharacterized protein